MSLNVVADVWPRVDSGGHERPCMAMVIVAPRGRMYEIRLCTYTGSSESTLLEVLLVLPPACTRRIAVAVETVASSDSSTVIPLSLMLTCREGLRSEGSLILVKCMLSCTRTALDLLAAESERLEITGVDVGGSL